MIISLIAAMDDNCLIGRGNDLPWRLPADLRYFKKVTEGKTVIMGRKTFESIGKPLPKRTNVIVTRNPEFTAEGCIVVHSLEEAIAATNSPEVMIIGGGEIYRQGLAIANRLYLTHVAGSFEGDTYFPEVDLSAWECISTEAHTADEKNPHNYRFCVYTGRKEEGTL